MISIESIDDGRYKVTIDAQTRSTHEVTVKRGDYERLTDGACSYEKLIRESMQFLLEREPNTSILRKFDLATIQRYFPEYESEIKSRLHSG